jgi:hypothetical protein
MVPGRPTTIVATETPFTINVLVLLERPESTTY